MTQQYFSSNYYYYYYYTINWNLEFKNIIFYTLEINPKYYIILLKCQILRKPSLWREFAKSYYITCILHFRKQQY